MGDKLYEIRHYRDDDVVDLNRKIYSCQQWKLGGIPYANGVACIYPNRQKLEEYVVDWFRKETLLNTYETYLKPLKGQTHWPRKQHLQTTLPPITKRLFGRPKQKNGIKGQVK